MPIDSQLTPAETTNQPAVAAPVQPSAPEVPVKNRTYLDYGIDALAIIAASVLLYLGVITETQWTATVVAVSAGRAALRLPGSPPSGGALSAIAFSLMSFFRHNRV